MQSAMLKPDVGEAPAVGVTVTPAPVEPSWLDHATGWLDVVPAWAWASILLVLTLFTVVSLPWASRQAFKAGRRAAGKDKADAKGTALFVAAMVPAAFFWLAVLAGSFRGLAGFGRDTLHWADGWEYLVPLTLDGVAISFGFLAFRAVRAGRSPERAIRIVMGTAFASAAINYGHEVSVGGSKLGGAYLGLLSLLGMLIFHEFLDQFTEGTAYIQRVNPKFGMRWLTWPSNTICAWIAWRNYPPTPLPRNATDEQKAWWGSINHAVKHLGIVRRAKRVARFAADVEDGRLAAPWWAPVAPWVRVRQLDAVIAERTAAQESERAEHAEIATRLERVVTEHRIAVAEAERMAEQATQMRAEQESAERRAAEAEQDAERVRSDAAEQLAKLRSEAAERERQLLSEHAERLAALRSDNSGPAGRNGRSTVTPFRRSKPAAKPDNPMATDTGALAAMFAEHPEPGYEWRDREAHRITGAGFSSRAPRLVGLASEHQRSCTAERHDGCFRSTDDDKEDSPDRHQYASAFA